MNPVKRESTRLGRGVRANSFGLAVTLLAQVVSVPVFLSSFGAARYGEWLVLFAIPAYLSLTDLGFSPVVGTEMTQLVARGRAAEAQALFRACSMLVLALSASAAVLVTMAFSTPAVYDLLGLELISPAATTLVVGLLGIYVVGVVQTSVLEAGFRATGNYPLGALNVAWVRLLDVVFLLAAVMLFRSPVAAAAALAVARSVGCLAIYLQLRRERVQMRLGRTGDWRAMRPLIRLGFSFSGFALGNAAMLQGMLVAAGATLGPLAVVVLNTTRIAVNLIRQVVNVVNHAVWPELSMRLADGERERAASLYGRALVINAVGSAVCAVALAAGGLQLLGVVLDDAVAVPATFFFLMLGVAVLDNIWTAAAGVLLAVNRHSRLAVTYAIASTVALGLSVGLLPTLELITVPLLMGAVVCVVSPLAFRQAAAVLEVSTAAVARDGARALLGRYRTRAG